MLSSVIDWISDSSNSSVTVAIIASLTAVVIMVYAYPRQKKIDRKHQLVVEQREVYRGYLKASASAVAESSYSDDEKVVFDAFRTLMNHRFDVLILGSDEVVKAVKMNADSVNTAILNIKQFKKTGSPLPDSEDFGEQLEVSYSNLVKVMREDCFESSSLSIDELKCLLPMYEAKSV